MSAEVKAADISARAKTLSEALWKVSGHASAVEWAANADALLLESARFLDRSEVRAALAKVPGVAA